MDLQNLKEHYGELISFMEKTDILNIISDCSVKKSATYLAMQRETAGNHTVISILIT